MPIGITVGYKNSNGEDIGEKLVLKDYLLDRYPELANTFRFAGLWLWGNNNYGQLGDNSIAAKSSPVQTIAGGANWKIIAAGRDHALGIKTDGTLWTWGANSWGQLGNNNTTARSSPVQTISSGTNWKQVAGSMINSAAIKTDGTLWTWGNNNNGQLGDNSTAAKSSPVQTISSGTNWKQVSSGINNCMAAIKTDGTLWTWGQNATYGVLGDNTTTDKSSPVQTVAGGTSWKQVSCVGSGHMAAIKTDGTLWTWGRNDSGQLGDNTITHRSSPVQTISSGINWKQVATGDFHVCAIKTDGTLWLWGSNNYGQLGDNTSTKKSSPVQTVSGGTNWKLVNSEGSGRFTSAIKTDGTLWVWGINNENQLSDNTVTNKSSPVQTVVGGTNWIQVIATQRWGAAIRDNSDDYI